MRGSVERHLTALCRTIAACQPENAACRRNAFPLDSATAALIPEEYSATVRLNPVVSRRYTHFKMNSSFDSLLRDFVPGAGVAWLFAVWILTAIIHVGFAFAVLQDSELL